MNGYLYQYNRNNDNNPYDDEDIKKEYLLNYVPYNQDIKVSLVYIHILKQLVIS